MTKRQAGDNSSVIEGNADLPGVRRRGFIGLLAAGTAGNYAALDTAEGNIEADSDRGTDDIETQDLAAYANRAGRVNHEKLREAFDDWNSGGIDAGFLERVIVAWRTGERVVEKEVIELASETGEIVEDTTLERNPNSNQDEAVVYQFTSEFGSDLRVEAKLTIEPGVVIEFGRNTGLNIEEGSGEIGSLVADGTSEDPILLTGTTPRRGWWNGVRIDTDGKAQHTLSNVTVEYGGGGEEPASNLHIEEDQATVNNCVLRHSGEYGLVLEFAELLDHEGDGSGSNTYLDNRYAPVRVDPDALHMLSGDSTYTSDDPDRRNGDEFVFVTTGSDSGDGPDQEERTLSNLGVPYRLTGDLTFLDMTWSVEPGTTLEFTHGTELELGDRIDLQGTAEDPIVFTGVEKKRGWWDGLKVDTDGTDNSMEHVVVEYAGNGLPGGLRLTGGSPLHIQNCTFRHNDGYGLYTGNVNLEPDGTAMKGNVYTGNAEGAVRTRTPSANHLSATSEFTGNDDDHVYVKGGADVKPDRITGAFTWDGIDVPYRVSGEEHRFFDLEWTVDPGATLEFESSGRINLKGSTTFNLEGEEGNEVTFTGTREVRGWWQGLRIGGSDADTNAVRHAVVEYAGNGQGGGLLLNGTTVHVEHCTFRHTDGYGLRVNDNVAVPDGKETANNVYTENSRGAARFQKNSANFLSATSQFTGNDDDHVYVNDAGISRASVVTWEAIGVPYRLQGAEHEINDYRLEVEPGTTIEFEERGWFDLQGDGYITIEGESDDEIRLTGTYDDGEDPHGWWGTLHIESEDESNTLTHTIVENGGSETSPAGDSNGTVRLQNGELDNMANCTVRKSRTAGLYVGSSSNVNSNVCEANEFEDNLEGDCVFE